MNPAVKNNAATIAAVDLTFVFLMIPPRCFAYCRDRINPSVSFLSWSAASMYLRMWAFQGFRPMASRHRSICEAVPVKGHQGKIHFRELGPGLGLELLDGRRVLALLGFDPGQGGVGHEAGGAPRRRSQEHKPGAESDGDEGQGGDSCGPGEGRVSGPGDELIKE
jgi:hypothetical protein